MSYIYNLTDTWNAAGTTFAGIKMAVTNTASGGSSKLLDLTVSGSTTGSFSVDKSGNLNLTGAVNNISITPPVTGSTLTISGGKTFIVNNTLTFTGTDTSSVDFATGGTVAYTASPTLVTPTFTTSATGPLFIGGTSTTSTLTLRSTSGVGTTNADIIFQTGNNGGTEVMRLLNNGNVGISTNAPRFNLSIGSLAVVNTATPSTLDMGGSYSNAAGSNVKLRVFWDGTIVNGLGASAFNFDYVATGSVAHVWYTAGSEKMRLTTEGELYIADTVDQGAYNLQVNGTGVWGAGAYVNGSDARLKEEIADISSCLDIIKSLRPVTFRYKSDYSSDTNIQPGFIAQELQTALAGQAYLGGVVQAGPRYLNVAYQTIIPMLTKAIQELAAEIAAIKEQRNA